MKDKILKEIEALEVRINSNNYIEIESEIKSLLIQLYYIK